MMDMDAQASNQELNDQRKRVAALLADSGKAETFKETIQSGALLLRPDLDISCDVGAQNEVLKVLNSFDPDYLRLVLEAVLKIKIEMTGEQQFKDLVNAIAPKQIFHSASIAKNKKYVYTIGNWLTDEGKKAVERHFLNIMCQILFLMEQCLQTRVIPDSGRMFKRDSTLHSINEVFGTLSRELISGKTLLPKVMELSGFKPTYICTESNPDQSTTNLQYSTPSTSRKPHETNSTKSKKSAIRDETQETLNLAEKVIVANPDSMKAKNDELNALRLKLVQIQEERDQYLQTCQELKQKISEDEVRHQQQLEGCPTESSKLFTRIQQRIEEEGANDSKINSLFNAMDQTDVTSMLNQTQETATNLENHAKKLTAYQSNVVALYEQLKHTAKFLSDIIQSLGLEDAQCQLLMQKISKLQLDMHENSGLSEAIVNDTRRMAVELTEVSIHLEETIRNGTIHMMQSSFIDQNKISDELIAKNAQLSQGIDKLTSEMSTLKGQLAVVEEARNQLETQISAVLKDKKTLMEKYNGAMKMVEERDEELKNRKNIIDELQSVASQKVELPVGLEKEIESQLGQIYSALSDVTNRTKK